MDNFHYGYTQRLSAVCPCKGCKDRHAECHSACQPYLDYEKKRMELNAQMEERWRIKAALNAHERETKRRKEKAWRQKGGD